MPRIPEEEERFRKNFERLHQAQLESLERPAEPFGDAYLALRGLLASAGTMGSLLVRIERQEGDVAETRRRLVRVAVECGTTVAHVLGLAFELEGRACRGSGPPPPAPPRGEVEGLRAVTDLNRMLRAQLQKLYQAMQGGAGWRHARPEELWSQLVGDVADLLPAAAALGLRDLAADERQGLETATAEAANRLAILRSYPRMPTV